MHLFLCSRRHSSTTAHVIVESRRGQYQIRPGQVSHCLCSDCHAPLRMLQMSRSLYKRVRCQSGNCANERWPRFLGLAIPNLASRFVSFSKHRMSLTSIVSDASSLTAQILKLKSRRCRIPKLKSRHCRDSEAKEQTLSASQSLLSSSALEQTGSLKSHASTLFPNHFV